MELNIFFFRNNPLVANPIKWSLKKFVGTSWQTVWVCLNICGVGA